MIRLLPDASEAEDVVQDAFISIFRNIHQYRSESSLYTWMRRIAVNKALDEIRKKKKQWVFVQDEYEMITFPALEENPERELVEQLHFEIKKLPDGCREILTLYLFEGFKHMEIAEKLGISESTSKSQYARAKQLLSLAMTKHKINE